MYKAIYSSYVLYGTLNIKPEIRGRLHATMVNEGNSFPVLERIKMFELLDMELEKHLRNLYEQFKQPKIQTKQEIEMDKQDFERWQRRKLVLDEALEHKKIDEGPPPRFKSPNWKPALAVAIVCYIFGYWWNGWTLWRLLDIRDMFPFFK